MDQQLSARWLETLKAEQRAQKQWETKYLTKEQQQREEAEQAEAFANLGPASTGRNKHVSERDAMELRLSALDDAPEPEEAPRVAPDYEVLRMKVAADVAATRQRCACRKCPQRNHHHEDATPT